MNYFSNPTIKSVNIAFSSQEKVDISLRFLFHFPNELFLSLTAVIEFLCCKCPRISGSLSLAGWCSWLLLVLMILSFCDF